MAEEIEPIKKKARRGDAIRLDYSKLSPEEIEARTKMIDDFFKDILFSEIEELSRALKAAIDSEKEEQK